jgi:hypothetical protein
MFHKAITAKHNDRCAKCGCGVAKGSPIVWVPKGCKVYHFVCFNAAPKYRFTADKVLRNLVDN